ncbi:hypothetical protein [Halobellus sp. Atlit-38R]|uniref:DUF7266 family protein n=1 Tax=Halobellus sp. Atlit-38R TaxID=2282131 RepID=UPI0018F6C681|nr:hypothetical protein [Halobellus sp. Atlit-38R]
MSGHRDAGGRRRSRGRPFDRGLSPVVGKTLELGVGVLFVALLTATFFGGIAPDYRAAVGTELGDRALLAAAERVEAAVPTDTDVRADRSVAVRLPPAIRGDPYRVVVANDTSRPALRLVHPDASIDGRIRLTVPDTTAVSGSWDSASPSRAVVVVTEGRLSIRLVDEGDSASRLTARDRARGSVSSTTEREAAT